MQRFNFFDYSQEEFSIEIIDEINRENLWNIWVPKSYGGLELSLIEGLKTLKILAQIDGSLGWTVTLCSGANFFVGNLKEQIAKELFINSKQVICFGGSGGVFGIAEKQAEGYIISGKWNYATGAPHLTHFTLNAKIQHKGKDLLDKDGNPIVRSFIVNKDDVEIIKDWKAMGLRATATHSFVVDSIFVDADFSFEYDKTYLSFPIFKTPFSIFADLTLWINYIGMSIHFYDEASKILTSESSLKSLKETYIIAEKRLFELASLIQEKTNNGNQIADNLSVEIHEEAYKSVQLLSRSIIDLYPKLGIRAASEDQMLNQVFKDFYTATQHHIFRDKI